MSPRQNYPDWLKKSFISTLNRILKKERMHKQELAVALGVTPSCVYRWMAGKTEPTLLMVLRIIKRYPYAAKYLGADPKLIPQNEADRPKFFHGMG